MVQWAQRNIFFLITRYSSYLILVMHVLEVKLLKNINIFNLLITTFKSILSDCSFHCFFFVVIKKHIYCVVKLIN